MEIHGNDDVEAMGVDCTYVHVEAPVDKTELVDKADKVDTADKCDHMVVQVDYNEHIRSVDN